MINAPGIKVHSAQVPAEYSYENGKLKVFVPCKPITGKWDTTRGVALHLEFEALMEDVIAVKFCHFAGIVDKGPSFSLNREETDTIFQEDEQTLSMQVGRLQVVIRKNAALDFAFFYDGKRLTGSNHGGMAYVTDVDYEAERWADMNAMPKRPAYMHETYMREELDLGVGEHIYGLGERYTPFVKNGQDVEIWNKDGGTISEQTYKNIPFYLSDKGYGVLVNHPEKVEFNVGTHNVRKVRFSVTGEKMQYIIIGAEEPKQVLSTYTLLTGRPALPPPWSFGLWFSTSWTTDYSEPVVTGFVRKMKENNIPLSVFHYDACWMREYHLCNFIWDERLGDCEQMFSRLKEAGLHICMWINPYVGQRSELFEEGMQKGYFLHTKEGNVWQADYFAMGMAIVDFTNPAAAEWYKGHLARLLDMGVDVFKTDFGERIPQDVVWYDHSDPSKMHNYYSYLYEKTVYDLIASKKGKENACIFARSATVGGQQFPVHWGGDNQASYVSMAESLRGGLSLCLSGFSFWAHDMAGFEDTASPDLYKRWSAFGMLSTHSRLHGWSSYRVPWNFDEEAVHVLSFFSRLKCALMPYIYRTAAESAASGIPSMRAMMLEFPYDETCAYLDRQYMLGESLLVAPVFSEDGIVRFYVPTGRWTNYIDGEVFEGDKWYERQYDYFALPLLVRPNTLLATGAEDMRADYDYEKDVLITAYQLTPGTQAECEVTDASGKTVLTVTALKEEGENGRIIVRASGETSGLSWKFRLYGSDEVFAGAPELIIG